MKKESIFIEPSIIGSRLGMVDSEAKSAVEAGAKILHLDVMDGLFVPNITIGPAIVQSISKAVPEAILDVHLMIYHPENFIEVMKSAGAHEITFHFEATEDHEYLINFIRKCGCKAGIAFKPETDESMIIKYITKVDKILIMTVEPGFGGQKFLPKMLEKVSLVRDFAQKAKIDVDIQVDGGIDDITAVKALEAGANRLVTGSYFFNQEDRRGGLAKLDSFKSNWKFE
jgi:ribulose-phosphate 3-epimerase